VEEVEMVEMVEMEQEDFLTPSAVKKVQAVIRELLVVLHGRIHKIMLSKHLMVRMDLNH
tara:strand:+ start:193 stop:369 length:177 start_codon:yes stop_codon:yes gene_type:complete